MKKTKLKTKSKSNKTHKINHKSHQTHPENTKPSKKKKNLNTQNKTQTLAQNHPYKQKKSDKISPPTQNKPPKHQKNTRTSLFLDCFRGSVATLSKKHPNLSFLRHHKRTCL